MTATPKAALITQMLRDAGAKPYPMLRGIADTSKVARFVLPNGNPIAVGIDNKTPTIWMLPQHERKAFRLVGNATLYPAAKSRNHHLHQVREFLNQPLEKIPVSTENLEDIRTAIRTVSGVI